MKNGVMKKEKCVIRRISTQDELYIMFPEKDRNDQSDSCDLELKAVLPGLEGRTLQTACRPLNGVLVHVELYPMPEQKAEKEDLSEVCRSMPTNALDDVREQGDRHALYEYGWGRIELGDPGYSRPYSHRALHASGGITNEIKYERTYEENYGRRDSSRNDGW